MTESEMNTINRIVEFNQLNEHRKLSLENYRLCVALWREFKGSEYSASAAKYRIRAEALLTQYWQYSVRMRNL